MEEEQWKCRIRFFRTIIIIAVPLQSHCSLVSSHTYEIKYADKICVLQIHQFCLQLQPFDVIALFIALHYYYIGIKLTVAKLSTECVCSQCHRCTQSAHPERKREIERESENGTEMWMIRNNCMIGMCLNSNMCVSKCIESVRPCRFITEFCHFVTRVYYIDIDSNCTTSTHFIYKWMCKQITFPKNF